jgi:hypothetical protein
MLFQYIDRKQSFAFLSRPKFIKSMLLLRF